MFPQIAWLGLFVCTVSVPANDPSVLQPALAGTPDAPAALAPRSQAGAWGRGEAAENPKTGLEQLSQELARLQTLRHALAAERTQGVAEADSPGDSTAEQISKLRLRLGELLTRASTQGTRDRTKNAAKPVPPPQASFAAPPAAAVKLVPQPPSKEPKQDKAKGAFATGDDKPVDALSLAAELFNLGDYEGALHAYQMVDPKSIGAEVRISVQYMTATCLRRLGKLEEAETMYREVANSRVDEMVTDCAQWQLSSIRWQREMEGEIEQLRQRRKGLEDKP